MPLTDEEVRAVLARAEEIQRTIRAGTDITAVIEAAERFGISRAAVEQALRERLNLSLPPPAAGSLAFARSANDKFYVAEVLEVRPDAVRVRFLRGSELLVTPDDVRPASFNPGEKVVCEWPWWGPWTCTVLAYDQRKQRIKVTDGWGSSRTFPIGEVWLPPPREPHEEVRVRRRVYATLVSAGAVLGAVIGTLVTLLLA
ncbi:MAG: hypothetical protein ACT4PM_00245 [Gemmatimonadales bacterium]